MFISTDEYGRVRCEEDNVLNDENSGNDQQVYWMVLAAIFAFACAYLVMANQGLKRNVSQYKKEKNNSVGEQLALHQKVRALELEIFNKDKKISSLSSKSHLPSSAVSYIEKKLEQAQSSSEKYRLQLDKVNKEVKTLQTTLKEKAHVESQLEVISKQVHQLEMKISSLDDEKQLLNEQRRRDLQKATDLESLLEDCENTHEALLEKFNLLDQNHVNVVDKLKIAEETIEHLKTAKNAEDEAMKSLLVKLALLTTK